jgi:hypothetical protein
MLRDGIKKLYGYIVSSKLRSNILKVLYKSTTLRQTEIAKKINCFWHFIGIRLQGLIFFSTTCSLTFLYSAFQPGNKPI